MASIKQNDVQITNNSINPDILKGQPLNLNQTRTDSANITNENDRNSNLSPSKSADPARKKTFKIISVKKGGSGSGDLPGDNDGDSIDGLDESQTEDLSSEFYDSSKATDLDMDLPDSMMPLTPDEVTSTTTIVVKQKPDRDSQSRFKVVKIETKEPFRRGKWVCYDYFDTTPASVVTLEKNGSKMTEDSILHSALSGNLSSSSSVHYVQDVNDSSSNIYVTPFAPISPIGADGQHLFSDVFVPIPLAPPASQVLNPGLSSADATPFIAQQVFLSMAGVPSSNTSFYSVAQPGQTTIIQSLPPTNVFPYAQNGPSASLFQNGVAGQSNVLVNLPPDPIIATASVIPAVIPPMQPISVADVTAVNQDHGPGYVIVGGIPVPRSQSQTQISGVPVLSQVLQPVIENGQSLPAVGISNATNVTYSSAESASAFSGLEVDQMGPGMDESTGSIKTLQGDPEGYPPQGLEEAVEAIHTGLEGNDEDADERRASAFVARSAPIRPNALPSFVNSRNTGSPSIVRPNAHLGSRNLDSPLHIWPSPLPSHLDSRNMDSPSHHWPNALPSYFDNRNLDSPCNFCFTPVGGRSLCSSPVPPSFIEHFDSMAAGMFPPTSNSYFPYMDPSSHGSYSQASAFVPLHMPQPSAAQPNHSSPCVTPSPKAMSYDSRGIRGALPTVRIDSAPELRRSLSPHSLSSPTTPYTTPPRPQSLTPGGTVFKRATSVDDNRTVADGHDKITDFLVSTVLPLDDHTPKDGYVRLLGFCL